MEWNLDNNLFIDAPKMSREVLLGGHCTCVNVSVDNKIVKEKKIRKKGNKGKLERKTRKRRELEGLCILQVWIMFFIFKAVLWRSSMFVSK